MTSANVNLLNSKLNLKTVIEQNYVHCKVFTIYFYAKNDFKI